MFDIISKDYILSRVSPEEIFEYYLNGLYCIGKTIPAPYRKDSTPSFALFYHSNGTLLYKDYARNKTGDCIEFVKTLFKLDTLTALKKVRHDILRDNNFGSSFYSTSDRSNNLPKYHNKAKTKTSFQISYKEKEFEKQETEYWKRYGISLDTLKLYGVKCIKYVYYNSRLWMESSAHSPIYIYQIQDQIKIYKPLTLKGYKWSGNMKSYTLLGIDLIPDGYNDLIILTKGYKDVMSIYENSGYYAVCKAGESCYWREDDIQRVHKKSKKLIYLGDFDYTGLMIANRLHREFNIPRIFLTTDRKSKRLDYSDFYLNFGKEKVVQRLNQLIYGH